MSLKRTENEQKLLPSCKSVPVVFQQQEPVLIGFTTQILSSKILKVKAISKVPSFQIQILHLKFKRSKDRFSFRINKNKIKE